LVDSSGLPHTSFATKTKIEIAKTVKPFMSLPFMQGIRSSLLRMSGSDDYNAFPELRETFVNIIREHIEFELPEIECKTLIIWGGDDDNSYTPVNDVTVFERLIPHADAHIIQNTGHYCFLDNPLEFQEAVLSFISDLYGKN
jgi:pimeloyl-ACP methyl ester carboxylesterase